MLVFYYGCEAVFNIIKLVMVFCLIDKIALPRCEEKKLRTIFVCTIVGLTGLSLYNVYMAQTTMFSNALLWLNTILVSVVIKRFYHIKWLDVFFDVYMLWVYVHIIDFFVQSVIYFLLDILALQTDILIDMGWMRGVYLVIFSLCIFLFKDKMNTWIGQMSTVKNKTLWQVIWIVLISIVLIYFQRVYMGVVTEGYMRSWSMFIMAMVLISGRMILHTRKLLLEERNLAQQSKIKLLEENYRHAIELYKEKAILLHDQRNHIQIINEYIRKGETEKALHYGECINKKLDGTRNRIWSNHQTIDMVLNMKAQEARDNNIEIDFRFEDMSDLAMEETDICALLFNLLDNAIEANLKIESIEKRWIKLSGTKQGCMLFINSTNPIGERLQREGERLLTTKVDKRNHGFGMESVKQIIDKYQGVVKIEEEEDVFFLDLVMMAISAN